MPTVRAGSTGRQLVWLIFLVTNAHLHTVLTALPLLLVFRHGHRLEPRVPSTKSSPESHAFWHHIPILSAPREP
ncbi:hypothetical protein BJ875DRAFT_453290 [Amylocarpus encephaloides]|uniref:Uncharacterized protein n=1 Tax=Amylocarpus encephaloides TaxID=45428 RepID=A0A9P7YPL5_9HELO|nr:hypothetical protein BJ875DRAFT_453290 [Amylocarpus encephaloides]